MRKTERHRLIADRLMTDGFVSVEQMAAMIGTSLVTIRRDFGELAEAGKLRRVHGGAEPAGETRHVFVGRSFERNQHRNVAAKRRIAKAAASLCGDGEAVIIDGGTTTHQMSSLLAGRGMQVLTNSLHIVHSLIADASTRLLVPGGEVFPAQNIILSTSGNDGLSDYRAKYMFMGAEAVCEDGIRQSDSLLAHSERRLIDLADKLVVLADASKFAAQAGFLVCSLNRVDTIITDQSPPQALAECLAGSGTRVIVAPDSSLGEPY